MTVQLTAEPLTEEARTTRSLCSFWLAGLSFGIDVLGVQEVIRQHELTIVPLAPPVVMGLMNLRGQIITTCDLRHRLGLGDHGSAESAMNVVVRSPGGPVALLVDEIGDVIDVEPSQFEQAPSTLTGPARDLIVGAYKLDDYLLLELDTQRVLSDLVTPEN